MAADKKTATGKQDQRFLFDKRNYLLFAVGALLIVVGFVLMGGGGSDDPNVFNPEIFSSTRISVAPILVLSVFVVYVFDIMLKPKQ